MTNCEASEKTPAFKDVLQFCNVVVDVVNDVLLGNIVDAAHSLNFLCPVGLVVGDVYNLELYFGKR